MSFELTFFGPFSLATANNYFGGWASLASADQSVLTMAFPVEGWRTSAAVVLHQDTESAIRGEVYHAEQNAALAWQQALAVLSLDNDARGWADVGRQDPVIGNLQHAYRFLRPVLFHSPYEAAAAFVIAHRISVQQGRAIRQALAQELGDKLIIGETTLYAFPRPQVLQELSSFKSLNAEKIERLHGIAQAALDGLLDRAYLRSLPVEEALAKLRSLRGIGNFFSQGILLRGAGLVDVVPDEDVTKEAAQLLYNLPQRPDQKAVLHLAEGWRPYRMWASVLMHVWLGRETGSPHRRHNS